jgi:hypothetical protein
MTLDFDPTRTYTGYDDRIAATTDPRHRRMLEIVRDHAKAEVERSLDGLMATLVAEPEYHFWVQGRDMGPKGDAAVRAYYTDFVLSGGAVLESIIERLIVDDGAVVQDSYIRNLVPIGVARRRGYAIPDGIDHVMVTYRNCVLWPFDDGDESTCLLLGEDSYTPLDLEAWEAVADADLPDYYLDYLAGIGHQS